MADTKAAVETAVSSRGCVAVTDSHVYCSGQAGGNTTLRMLLCWL